ncbi:PRTRC system protein E [Xanthomonas hortorum pv. vitians]|nr:PRTRC system protein E [Xanthomonas hortorum pv. vitians]
MRGHGMLTTHPRRLPMSFIANVLPLLKHGSSLSLTLKEVGGQIQILIEPQLAKLDPDTTDEVVATLQAALVHPVRVLAERDATDATLLEILTKLAPSYSTLGDQLAEHQQRIEDAAAAARAKAAEKAAAKPAGKATPSKATNKAATPATSASASNTDDSGGDDDANGDDAGDSPVATPSEAPAAPSPSTASFELF